MIFPLGKQTTTCLPSRQLHNWQFNGEFCSFARLALKGYCSTQLLNEFFNDCLFHFMAVLKQFFDDLIGFFMIQKKTLPKKADAYFSGAIWKTSLRWQ